MPIAVVAFAQYIADRTATPAVVVGCHQLVLDPKRADPVSRVVLALSRAAPVWDRAPCPPLACVFLRTGVLDLRGIKRGASGARAHREPASAVAVVLARGAATAVGLRGRLHRWRVFSCRCC